MEDGRPTPRQPASVVSELSHQEAGTLKTLVLLPARILSLGSMNRSGGKGAVSEPPEMACKVVSLFWEQAHNLYQSLNDP